MLGFPNSVQLQSSRSIIFHTKRNIQIGGQTIRFVIYRKQYQSSVLKEAYLNKFLTCARTREFDNQALDHTFFQLEHCKPLFKQQNILAFKNLYTYHTFMEVFKILKLRCPTSLNQHYQLSSRKQTALIAQLPSNDFISRSTKIWSTIAPKLKLFDFSYKISLAKSRLKKSLLKLQHAYNDSAWTSSDYDMMKLSFENNPLQKI